MCGRVNSNPSLANNSNFNLLVSKCRGVVLLQEITLDLMILKFIWDDMKDDYKKREPRHQFNGR